MAKIGRPKKGYKIIEVGFLPETLEEIDKRVGPLNRSEFIRRATQGALETSEIVVEHLTKSDD